MTEEEARQKILRAAEYILNNPRANLDRLFIAMWEYEEAKRPKEVVESESIAQ